MLQVVAVDGAPLHPAWTAADSAVLVYYRAARRCRLGPGHGGLPGTVPGHHLQLPRPELLTDHPAAADR
jgi:hypothetical protein